MRELKYIIIGHTIHEPRAILFNGIFNHSDIWLGARRSLSGATLITAGFCYIEDGNINVHGGSESLTKLLKKEVKSSTFDVIGDQEDAG